MSYGFQGCQGLGIRKHQATQSPSVYTAPGVQQLSLVIWVQVPPQGSLNPGGLLFQGLMPKMIYLNMQNRFLRNSPLPGRLGLTAPSGTLGTGPLLHDPLGQPGFSGTVASGYTHNKTSVFFYQPLMYPSEGAQCISPHLVPLSTETWRGTSRARAFGMV